METAAYLPTHTHTVMYKQSVLSSPSLSFSSTNLSDSLSPYFLSSSSIRAQSSLAGLRFKGFEAG